MTELQLLRRNFSHLRAIYHACVEHAHNKMRVRIFIHAWLAEVGLTVAQIERQIVQLEAMKEPAPQLLSAAWDKYFRAHAALELTNAAPPKAVSPNASVSGASEVTLPRVTLGPVANRLRVVYLFLVLQILAAVGLLGYSVWLFERFDPHTALSRQQFAARAPARANVARLRLLLESTINEQKNAPPVAAAAGAGAPQPSTPASHDNEDARKVAIRGEVESVVAALGELPLASSDLKLANVWLDNVLTALDADVADYPRMLGVVKDLENALGAVQGEQPPSIVWTIVLGSLLGMITITIHLNWKFRNQWDTAGFIPWYVTKLAAAPIISLAAAGFLSQVRFSGDVAAATDISGLGLLGASPLLVFAIAIVTGLFSNRVFDWLKDTVTRVTRTTRQRPAAEQPHGGGMNTSTVSTDDGGSLSTPNS